MAPTADRATSTSSTRRRHIAATSHGSFGSNDVPLPENTPATPSNRPRQKPRHGVATIDARRIGGALGPTPGTRGIRGDEDEPTGPGLIKRAE
ncbi:hypothetical protein GCM10007918_41400 [Piscinibacter gummiphilus]|nr:hypothetical protein GCM10007918_41400 [Piscinibacter gummiphilus]